jgi:carbamoyltransferase
MIAVGIGRAYHDCSISVYNNGGFKYAKYERESSEKHLRAPETWFWKKLIQWGIDLDKIDIIVETDGGQWHENKGKDVKNPKLPHNDTLICRKHKSQHKTLHFLIDHHFAHAWSNTNFTKHSQAFILDGVGSNNNTNMNYYGETRIERSKDYSPGTSLSLIGGRIGLGKGAHLDNAGKVMGLVPYGSPIDSFVNSFSFNISKSLPTIIEKLNFGLTSIPAEDKACGDDWKKMTNSVASLNELCYKVVLEKIKKFDKSKPIIYAGGCALNVDWNRRLRDLGYNLLIEPHVYDGGLSIGCLRYALSRFDIDLYEIQNFPYVQDDISPDSPPSDITINKVAELLSEGKIVGWYQGNGEIGPRALGNRSILMDPTIKNGKQIMNDKVKRREWFRPFGASVLKEDASKYFDLDDNPYMLYTSKVLSKDLHSITHVDNSCRHQTVDYKSNEAFYTLINRFKEKTGVSVLLNTSLNLGGKPIAGDPKDAIELLKTSDMDALCIGDEVYVK